MSEWNFFKFEEPRPERSAQLDESHRTIFEKQVSLYVSRLLGFFGDIVTVEVDNGGMIEVDCSATYETLALDRTELTDGSELLIEQIPDSPEGYRNEPGLHTIAHHSAEDSSMRSYAVWDVAVNIEPPVHYPGGRRVPISELVELCDALIVINDSFENPENPVAPNAPPHETYSFPRRAVDAEFLAIIQG